ncbi:MAG: hypothetical protein WA803_21045 [Steroidobacteraceae bacterium]
MTTRFDARYINYGFALTSLVLRVVANYHRRASSLREDRNLEFEPSEPGISIAYRVPRSGFERRLGGAAGGFAAMTLETLTID